MPSYSTHDPKGWCGDPRRGAAVGRHSIHRAEPEGKMTLQKVRINGGGYDRNGTYFGVGGEPLYWFADAGGNVDGVLRASSRAVAKVLVRALFPETELRGRFYR